MEEQDICIVSIESDIPGKHGYKYADIRLRVNQRTYNLLFIYKYEKKIWNFIGDENFHEFISCVPNKYFSGVLTSLLVTYLFGDSKFRLPFTIDKNLQSWSPDTEGDRPNQKQFANYLYGLDGWQGQQARTD